MSESDTPQELTISSMQTLVQRAWMVIVKSSLPYGTPDNTAGPLETSPDIRDAS